MKQDDSPLIAACTRGSLGIVQEIIRAGADVNMRVNVSISISTIYHTF